MQLEIKNRNLSLNQSQQKLNYKPAFKGGPLGGLVTQALTAIETNPMVDAALVDIFAMVLPRTYVDTKERNQYAGAETFIRESAGTFCVCLSSGIFAKGISRLYNNFVNSDTKINPDIWATKAGVNLLNHAWIKSETNGQPDVQKYVSNVLTNMSGLDGRKNVGWNDINWQRNNDDWLDEPKWKNIQWKDSKYENIQNSLKSSGNIIKTLSEIITDRSIDKKDAKNIQEIISYRLTTALGVGNSVDVALGEHKLNSSMSNIIRDTYDLGKDIFTNKSINTEVALKKLESMSKFKTLGALSLSSFLALITQYVNRQITKKRTGTDAFVGEVDYGKIKNEKNADKNLNGNKSENKAKLWSLKALASAGMAAMSLYVMKIDPRKPAEALRKMEFTGVVTSGNAMKTIYAAQLIGRFMASKNETELRETTTRDYLGFLNWLVFGGFVSKGVGQLLFDRKLDNLFNVSGKTKGISNWLNNFDRKSHAEIAAKGKKFAVKNIKKIDFMQASGLLYSTIALGVLLPLLNIVITKKKQKNDKQEGVVGK